MQEKQIALSKRVDSCSVILREVGNGVEVKVCGSFVCLLVGWLVDWCAHWVSLKSISPRGGIRNKKKRRRKREARRENQHGVTSFLFPLSSFSLVSFHFSLCLLRDKDNKG